jgi:hypothetical protein
VTIAWSIQALGPGPATTPPRREACFYDFCGTSLTWTGDEVCIPTSLRENVTSLRGR